MFARFLNHSSIFGRTIKTYEYAYGASDYDGSEGEPPLPPSILKRYYVPVGYTIRAAPMDSGCTTTTFAHSDGFTNTWESTSRLRVADQKTHKPDFEGSASVLIYTRPGKTTPLTIERALHCPKVTTLFSAKSLVSAGHEVCLRLNQPGLKMVDGPFVPLVDYDGRFWLVYLVPDSNYKYVDHFSSKNSKKNKMSSQKNASNTCDAQGRTVDRVANETAAGGSIANTSKNTIVASDVERSPANVKVPDINYGYNPSELLHDRLGHIGRTRLEATKNRSTGLEKLFKNYKPIHFCTACCKAKMTKGSHSPCGNLFRWI